MSIDRETAMSQREVDGLIGGGHGGASACRSLPAPAAAHSCGSPERDESQLDNVALGALDNARWLR